MDTKASQNPANKAIIFTDGSYNKNLRDMGGWAYAICRNGKNISTGSGYCTNTTPEEMEFSAVVHALISLGNTKHNVDIYSDCRFVCSMQDEVNLTKCLYGKKGYCVDVDVFADLIRLCNFHNVSFHWVKGHADNKLNCYVDQLAKAATKIGYNKIYGPNYKGNNRRKRIEVKIS